MHFWEMSSISEVDNIKNEAILGAFLQKWKVESRADGLVPMLFAFVLLHLSKVLRLPRKIDVRSYEVVHLSRKVIFANLKVSCSEMQPFSGNQCPDLLTSLMNMSLVLPLPRDMHLCRSSSNVPHLPSFLEMLQNPHVLLKVQNPSCLPHERTLQRPKVVAPNLVCFVDFDFEMCFAPQRRALFEHLIFQKWSEHGVFCTFLLRNVLRATTACNFSSLICPDGSAPAALARDPLEPQTTGKTKCSRLFYPFGAPASSFFWLFLFSNLLSSSLLLSSLLWFFPPLLFPSVHIVGSLTSKLPSITTLRSEFLHGPHCAKDLSESRLRQLPGGGILPPQLRVLRLGSINWEFHWRSLRLDDGWPESE